DGQGGTVTDTFDITVANTNDAPTVANAIADQSATEDAAFNFQFASNTFADVDAGATLTYTPTKADGTPLPASLPFTPPTRPSPPRPAHAPARPPTLTLASLPGGFPIMTGRAVRSSIHLTLPWRTPTMLRPWPMPSPIRALRKMLPLISSSLPTCSPM